MNRKKLRKLFETSTVAKPSHLLGKNDTEAEWTVRLLTGPFLDLKFLGHRKRFWMENRSMKGCNLLSREYRWGFFNVRKEKSSTILDHDDKQNKLTRRIHTEIRTTNYANLMIGRFYVHLFGRPRFVGYFTLRRRGDRQRTPQSRLTNKRSSIL